MISSGYDIYTDRQKTPLPFSYFKAIFDSIGTD